MPLSYLQAEEPAEAMDNAEVDKTSTTETSTMENPTIEDEEEGAEELLQAHTAVDSEAFDQAMKDRLREQGDRFDEMVAHEEDIRLGDEGWKERYYQVSADSPPFLGQYLLLSCLLGLMACGTTILPRQRRSKHHLLYCRSGDNFQHGLVSGPYRQYSSGLP